MSRATIEARAGWQTKSYFGSLWILSALGGKLTKTLPRCGMTKVQWLCALSFLLLIAGCLYNLRTGSVAAGPWSYNRRENPVGFFVTVLTIFVVAAVCILFVAVAYGSAG